MKFQWFVEKLWESKPYHRIKNRQYKKIKKKLIAQCLESYKLIDLTKRVDIFLDSSWRYGIYCDFPGDTVYISPNLTLKGNFIKMVKRVKPNL